MLNNYLYDFLSHSFVQRYKIKQKHKQDVYDALWKKDFFLRFLIMLLSERGDASRIFRESIRCLRQCAYFFFG